MCCRAHLCVCSLETTSLSVEQVCIYACVGVGLLASQVLNVAGKMFECRPETMVSSIKKITQLPHNSLLFPGQCVCVTYIIRLAIESGRTRVHLAECEVH